MTKDHTLIAEQQRNGILSEDEARVHPQKHLLTSALGGFHKRPKMDISRTLIRRKDLYLLCTDGLHSMLDDKKILSTISSIHDRSLYKIGLSLILEANLAGGLDNITIILLAFY
jgi:protein phosphatase